jgi:hypothetical protein
MCRRQRQLSSHDRTHPWSLTNSRMYRWSLIVTLVTFSGLPSVVGAQSRTDTGSVVTTTGRTADSVWLNTGSGIYHCRGSQYFGSTRRGRFLQEIDAQKAGYRPAFGRTCGAPPSPTLKSDVTSNMRVWVNTSSRVYHCPGARYYGNTKQGRYMTESAARSEGNRPAGGRACS